MKMTLKATSRASVKVQNKVMGDVYCTFEYGEERFYDDISTPEQYEGYKQKLWECVNAEVLKQIQDTMSK